MADKNKVEFGISNLHIGTFATDDSGAVTLGTPYHLPGAKTLSLEPDSESDDAYADNVKYWSGFSDNGFSGSLEVMRFTTEFKKQFAGYVELDDGGLAYIKGANKPNVYLAFQTEGDAQSRRVIVYNIAFGGINREYATIEGSKEPATESVDITASGDNETGITMVSYFPTDEGYATLFTNPPVPTLPTAQTGSRSERGGNA